MQCDATYSSVLRFVEISALHLQNSFLTMNMMVYRYQTTRGHRNLGTHARECESLYKLGPRPLVQKVVCKTVTSTINPLKTKRICFIYKDSVRTAL
jgi:hypothetical protein